MGAYPAIAGGGASLPIQVPAGGNLAAMSTPGNMLIGDGSGADAPSTLLLGCTNLVAINSIDTWIARQGVGVLLTVRQQQNAADESATVGAAGAAAALPATPLGYWIRKTSGGVDVKVPYYNS